MKTYQIIVLNALGMPHFETAPIDDRKHALAVVRDLANAFGPECIQVTTRTMRREGDEFKTERCGVFLHMAR